MKNILMSIFMLTSYSLIAQQLKTAKVDLTDTTKTVSIQTKFEEAKMAAKDGYVINGYIVNISFEQAKLLDGKQIKITGLYTIVEGLESQLKEYDKNGNEIIMQGRLNDTKHIESPKIEIIDN